MAGPIRVIVHSGEHGLEEAADYYQEFPHEPSPAGDLDLDGAVITRIKDATLDLALQEMANAPAAVESCCWSVMPGMKGCLCRWRQAPA